MSDGESSENEGNEEDETLGQVEEDEGGQVVHNVEVEAEEDFNIDVEPIQTDDEIGEQSREVSHEWNGFKIVGDNIDKNIRPSFQRINHQTVSLHYFHSCAVSDRINLSSLSDVAPSEVLLNPASFLPNAMDLDAVKKEFQVHICRYVYMKCA